MGQGFGTQFLKVTCKYFSIGIVPYIRVHVCLPNQRVDLAHSLPVAGVEGQEKEDRDQERKTIFLSDGSTTVFLL